MNDATQALFIVITSYSIHYTKLYERTLGLYFSPVNFYYGFDADGELSHFLAEVSNTPWNERHQYAYLVGDGNLSPLQEKAFHVSPFNPIEQHYRWRIEPPGETVGVVIEVSDKRGDVFAARLRLERQPLTLATARIRITSYNVCYTKLLRGIPDCSLI